MNSTRCSALILPLMILGIGAPAWAAENARSGTDIVSRDWPNWRGPFCNASAVDCGEELVENLSAARLLWRSEEAIPNSGGQQKNLGTGYNDVIVADGRAYLSFFVQAGPPERIRQTVRALLTPEVKGRGRFALSVGDMMPGTPVAHREAVYEAVKELGTYPR